MTFFTNSCYSKNDPKIINIIILLLSVFFVVVLPISTLAQKAPSPSPSPSPSPGQLRQYIWDIAYIPRAPDCVDSIVMGINGSFPGPEIRARKGDTIRVIVTNNLDTEGVVIHWHGIKQRGTPWMDGTASISQCPINTGATYTYEFKVDTPGTYFYHGHYGMQRAAGLYGSLIVENDEEHLQYDREFNLLLSDWWHISSHEQSTYLDTRPMDFYGEPQALLINGVGHNCSMVPPTYETSNISGSLLQPCQFEKFEEQGCPLQIFDVARSKTYRLRVASTTSLASLNLAIQGHTMTVVEADGNYVEPFEVNNLDIYSGESYSVLFTTAANPQQDTYWISIGVRGRLPETPQTLAILRYLPINNVPTPSNIQIPTTPPPIVPQYDNYTLSKEFSNKIKSNTPQNTNYDPNNYKRLVLVTTQNTLENYTKWFINNISLTLPATSLLGAVKYGLDDAYDSQYSPPERPDGRNLMFGGAPYKFNFNETVDVIIQNSLIVGDHEIHPWHLHAHDFWVLGYGENAFGDSDEKDFNTVNPPLKNTVVVYPQGWTALRFRADNPGLWIFHCHIEPHLDMGMGAVFAEDVGAIQQMQIPSDVRSVFTCGLNATDISKIFASP